MRKLLLQLDSSPHPSVFDQVVAHDGGAEQIMSYGGVTPDAVRDLVHGAIFTRGPKHLHNTAIFVGGADTARGEELLAAVRKSFMGPFRVSVMLDSNGSNTTAVAAVQKIQEATGGSTGLAGRRVVIVAGTGPVGVRAAGLLGKAGADVILTGRSESRLAEVKRHIVERFGVAVETRLMAGSSNAASVLEGADVLLNTGPAGVCLVPRGVWEQSATLKAAADLNAVAPLGVEGIEVGDDGVQRGGLMAFGAIGVGNLKMKIHKACIARLFERSDVILDAETIAEVAREIMPS